MNSTNEQPVNHSQPSISMASLSSNPAAHAVSATHELLCDIIGLLPMGDIVVATGVCRIWRNALMSNLIIQQALYLTPVNTREIVTTKDYFSESIEDINRDECAVVTEPHPFIKRVCDQMYSFARLDSYKKSASQEYRPQPKFKHPNGIWREMFIAQPPINIVDIEMFPSFIFYTEFDGTPHTRSNFYTGPDGTRFFCSSFMARKSTLRDDQGITIGKLNDFIQSRALPGLQKPVFIRLSVPQEHFLERSITETSRYKFWCEVRDGKVSRQTQPPHVMAEDELW
jgi:hypothetical protein